MKMKAVDSKTNQLLKHTKVQLQIKGRDSGILTLTTDANGEMTLDDKYKGQQVSSTTNGQGQWMPVTDNLTIKIQTAQGSGSHGSKDSKGGAGKEKSKETTWNK